LVVVWPHGYVQKMDHNLAALANVMLSVFKGMALWHSGRSDQ